VRLSGNVPQFRGVPLAQALGIPADGLIYLNSLAIPGFADFGDSGSAKVPYSQNWNLSFAFEPLRNTVVEVAYVGNKGTHLYMPLVNINPRNLDFIESLEVNPAATGNAETAFSDPLGRRNLLGAVIGVARGNVLSPYFGFGNLNRFFDPSANSIRHAGYIDVNRRVGQGLTVSANYTYGKSIDDASDANPDTRVITEVGQTQGQVYYGAPRSSDRAISTFDIKHNFSSRVLWDLPFGRGRALMKDAPALVNFVAGGWTVSSIFRMPGGTPFVPFITDTNRLGGVNRTEESFVEGGLSVWHLVRQCHALRTLSQSGSVYAPGQRLAGQRPANIGCSRTPAGVLRLLLPEKLSFSLQRQRGEAANQLPGGLDQCL
jgi:hypothetical protein